MDQNDGSLTLKLSRSDNPQATLFTEVYQAMGTKNVVEVEVLDVRPMDHLIGIVFRRKYPAEERYPEGRIQYQYLLATSDTEKFKKETGYDMILSPAQDSLEWVATQMWNLHNLGDSPSRDLNWRLRLVTAKKLEAETSTQGRTAKLTMDFSVTEALLNGEPWQTRPSYRAGEPVWGLFKPEDARLFVSTVASRPMGTRIHQYRPYGEFIEQGFGGLEPMREFFRKYAKDEAELTEFVRKMELIQKAENEYVRKIEEKVKAGPTPEEVEATRQFWQEQEELRKKEAESRKIFEAEEKERWRQHMKRRMEVREKQRKLVEEMENDAE